MRRFRDRQAGEWEVVLGRASWGTHCLLFAPVTGSSATRQVTLRAESLEEATAQFDNMDDTRLQELLDASQPWDDH